MTRRDVGTVVGALFCFLSIGLLAGMTSANAFVNANAPVVADTLPASCPKDSLFVQLNLGDTTRAATLSGWMRCSRPTVTPPVTPPVVVPPVVTTPPIVTGGFVGFAELPRVRLDTMVTSARNAIVLRTIAVSTSVALQRALDSARTGDLIRLACGVYVGPFTLRVLNNRWVTVASDSAKPLGPRVTPSSVGCRPQVYSGDPTTPAVKTDPGAHHYRITGLEITAKPGAITGYTLVAIGDGSAAQNTIAKQPYAIVVDGNFIHGTPTYNFQRAISLQSGATAIVDNWISDVHGKGFDSQGIGGWNGTGPYHIVNNYIEAAGENVMFGGADPQIPNVVPSDITFMGNHVTKPKAWYVAGAGKGPWTVKNLFELKIGQRVRIENNVFENTWVDAQDYAVLFKSVNQNGRAPWSGTRDVVFQWNLIRNAPNGLNASAHPETTAVVPMSNVTIANNWFDRIGTGDFLGVNGSGRLWQLAGVDSMTFTNNTGFSVTHGLVLTGAKAKALTFTGNCFGTTQVNWSTWNYAVSSADGKGYGTAALNAHATNWAFKRNALPGGVTVAQFPDSNDYRIPRTCTNVGVDTAALNKKLAGVVQTP